MSKVIYKAVPYNKSLVTQALEAGVDAIITEASAVDTVAALARVEVLAEENIENIKYKFSDFIQKWPDKSGSFDFYYSPKKDVFHAPEIIPLSSSK